MIIRSLQIHSVIGRSEVNGSGTRMVLWLRGCDQSCKDCANANLIPVEGGIGVSVPDIVRTIRVGIGAGDISGLSISGGEPLLQAPALLAVLGMIGKEIPVRLYTHYTREDIAVLSPYDSRRIVAESVDELICGEYTVEGHRIHREVPDDQVEIHVRENGDMEVTGGFGAAAILKDPAFREN